ncbi:MAG: formylmethanofuran dehydrogenase [Candidatus Cloacimonetes bacterium]|nr:formylmethanofuran dehydrogenase [Candidatus Cloacimonadota bacterium]
MEISYSEVVKFHGHSCPGLAIGYRMTQAAMDFLQIERPKDEELVAIVENDACGVDAVQYLSGCTFGKGNLIFKDFGKMVYTFYDRKSKRAVRIIRKSLTRKKIDDQSREQKIQSILNSSSQEFFKIKEVTIKEPEFARLLDTAVCDECNETAVESKTHKLENKILCQPCFEKN